MAKKHIPLVGSVFLKDEMEFTIEIKRSRADAPVLRLRPLTARPGDTITWTYPESGIEIKFS